MAFSARTMPMIVVGGIKSVASVSISRYGVEQFSIAGRPRGPHQLPAGNPFYLTEQYNDGQYQRATLNFNASECNNWHTHFHHNDVLNLPMAVVGEPAEVLSVSLICVELELAQALSLVHDIKYAALRTISNVVVQLWHALRVRVPPRPTEAAFAISDDDQPAMIEPALTDRPLKVDASINHRPSIPGS